MLASTIPDSQRFVSRSMGKALTLSTPSTEYHLKLKAGLKIKDTPLTVISLSLRYSPNMRNRSHGYGGNRQEGESEKIRSAKYHFRSGSENEDTDFTTEFTK